MYIYYDGLNDKVYYHQSVGFYKCFLMFCSVKMHTHTHNILDLIDITFIFFGITNNFTLEKYYNCFFLQNKSIFLSL
uniref:Uncharacterized protein n=1 Tax=Strongyloides papillosus TaxID=174720 RepID=A0A0N5BS99_STREA